MQNTNRQLLSYRECMHKIAADNWWENLKESIKGIDWGKQGDNINNMLTGGIWGMPAGLLLSVLSPKGSWLRRWGMPLGLLSGLAGGAGWNGMKSIWDKMRNDTPPAATPTQPVTANFATTVPGLVQKELEKSQKGLIGPRVPPTYDPSAITAQEIGEEYNTDPTIGKAR